MKTVITAALIAAFVRIADASELPDYPFVYVRGEAVSKVAPDICVIHYRVTIRDRDSAIAMKSFETLSAKTLAVLFEHGVKREDVVASDIDKHVVRGDEQRDKLLILGYEITRHIEFTLRDLTKYGAVVSALMKTDDVTVYDTEYDRTDREEIESRLLTEAISKARAKAELLAEGSGQRIVKLRAISPVGFRELSVDFGLSSTSEISVLNSVAPETVIRELEEMLFVPATIEFRNSVSVIYELAESK
ncbi:MAG: SIMPL domain-containing protein [Pirellulaceae bacterium]